MQALVSCSWAWPMPALAPQGRAGRPAPQGPLFTDAGTGPAPEGLYFWACLLGLLDLTLAGLPASQSCPVGRSPLAPHVLPHCCGAFDACTSATTSITLLTWGVCARVQLVLLRLSVNSGPAVARNVGLAWVAAQGVSVACLLDADCSPGPGWLAAMAAAQAAEPGIVCGRTFACQPGTAVGARPPRTRGGERGWRQAVCAGRRQLRARACRLCI